MINNPYVPGDPYSYDLKWIVNNLKELQEGLDTVKQIYTAPITIEHASDMTDANKIYVYVGSEAGYNYGHWYYYDPDTNLWTDGGVYGGYSLDDTLSLSSHNAVENATITAAFNDVDTDISNINGDIGDINDDIDDINNSLSTITTALNGKQNALTFPLTLVQGGTGADNADDARANLGIRTKTYVFGSTARTFIVPANSRHILVMGGSNTTNNYGLWLMGATSNNVITVAEIAKGSNITFTVSGNTITILSQTYGATLLDWAISGTIIEPDE